MLRGQNKCPEAFGGDPSLTHSFNLRSEYSGNISLRIGEAGLQTGASSGSTSKGESKIASSSSNGNGGNPSAAGRGSFDSCGILENRDFGGGGTSLGGGVRAGGDGIDVGFRIDSIKDRDNKGGSQGGGSSTWTAGHHSPGDHTHSQGSDTSPSQSAEGSKKSNSKDEASSGSSDNKNGSKQGATSNDAGGTAGQSKGDGGENTSSRNGSGQNNNSQNGPAGGGDGNEHGDVDSPPDSEEPSPQIIPNTTPNPTAQTQPAATSTSGASNEGPSPDVTPILTTSPESSTSTTDEDDSTLGMNAAVESPSSLQSASTSTVANNHISPTGRNTTASPPGSTATTVTVSPFVAGNTISTSTNSRGLVGGIIGGMIAFSALLTLLIFLLVRKRRRLRITSSLFNFDTEKFVGAKRSAEPVDEARVSTSATHLVSPLVVKLEPPSEASEWGDDRCHDDHDEAFRSTQASRENVAKPFQDAAHARTSIIFDPFVDPVPVVEDPFHDPAQEPRHACRDSGTSSLAMSYEEGTVQEASRVPVQRLGSSMLSFDHDTFAKLR
ncbi:hypothetical protein F5146DRAFT_1022282 [Armillaria mellea]|nr:hypothetical protein F5146DRAFT_1022282 [Armillaria mellea]